MKEWNWTSIEQAGYCASLCIVRYNNGEFECTVSYVKSARYTSIGAIAKPLIKVLVHTRTKIALTGWRELT